MRRNMDDEFRRRERDARRMGDTASRAALLQGAMRAGTLSPEAVSFASRLGDPAAREIYPEQTRFTQWTRRILQETRGVVSDRHIVAWLLDCFEDTQRRRLAAVAGTPIARDRNFQPIGPRTNIGQALRITRMWTDGRGPPPTVDYVRSASRAVFGDLVRQSASYVVMTAWAMNDPDLSTRVASNNTPPWANYAFVSLDAESQVGRWPDLFAWQCARLVQYVLGEQNKHRANPSTVESLRQSISDYGPESARRFARFYPQSASGELRPHATEKLYLGKKVHWIGTPGHMVRVTPDYVRNLEGNVFDPEKLAAVSWFIRRSDEPVVMRPGYGQVVATTSIDDIAESLQYAKDAEIFGEDRTLSTDDEELDAYLKDPQTYLSDNLRWYDGPGSESDDEDLAKAGLRAQMEEKKAQAVREGWGDLGARRFTILDGNHRSFGALLAGEPFIWIRLLENDYQDFVRGGRPDLKGVLENPADTRFDDFLHELPFFLESDEALAAISGLKTHGDNPWLGGGCFVLTEALLEFLGPGANALDVVSDGLDLHSVVEAGGVWIDGGGSFAPAQARQLFPGMTGTEPHERMADKRMVKRLVSALRAKFGTVMPA